MGGEEQLKKIPMDEVQAPTPNQIAKFLEIADNALEDNEAVAVHCRGGNGRTGTVGPLPDRQRQEMYFWPLFYRRILYARIDKEDMIWKYPYHLDFVLNI